MDSEENIPQEEKRNLFKQLREKIFPIKSTDNAVTRFGKNTGFIVFSALFCIVSLIIIIGIALAL